MSSTAEREESRCMEIFGRYDNALLDLWSLREAGDGDKFLEYYDKYYRDIFSIEDMAVGPVGEAAYRWSIHKEYLKGFRGARDTFWKEKHSKEKQS